MSNADEFSSCGQVQQNRFSAFSNRSVGRDVQPALLSSSLVKRISHNNCPGHILGRRAGHFFTWDSHVVVSGSWNISRSFSLAGCGCWHRHLWEGWRQITLPGETTLIHARKFVELCRPKWRHPDLTSQYLRLLDSHILFDARLPFFLKAHDDRWCSLKGCS